MVVVWDRIDNSKLWRNFQSHVRKQHENDGAPILSVAIRFSTNLMPEASIVR